MGRYKPPQAPGSPYITRAGFVALRTELDYIWREKRPAVTKRITAAAAEGDRSENAEYIYSKKQLREIDRRVRYLQKRLEVLQVVEQQPADTTCIFFGAWVTLENVQAQRVTYRIVGSDEFDVKKEYISMDSPMAKALMRKRVDDEVTVKKPQGESIYYVLEIWYESHPA